jgi:outer membrane protein assembly factor BamB
MRRLVSVLGGVVAACVAFAQDVKPLAVENLGVPVTTMESADFTLCSKSGRRQHLRFFHPMRREIECQARIVDFATGQVREASGPPDRPLRMLELGDRFYFGQYGRCGLWIYDPETMKIEYKEGPDIGRCVVFQMAVGGDGAIYLGMTSGCEVIRFDPAGGEFRNYGRQGPKVAGPRYVYSMAAEGEYVYSAAGKNPWYLVALNIKTGEQKILYSEPKYLSVGGGGAFASASATVDGKDGKEEARHWTLKGGEMIEAAAQGANKTGDACIVLRDRARLFAYSGGVKKEALLGGEALPEKGDLLVAVGPGAKAAIASVAGILLVDLKAGAVGKRALPPVPDGVVSAMGWTDDGVLLFSLKGSNRLYALNAEAEKRELAKLHDSARLNVGTIITEGPFAYVATAEPEDVLIVDTRDGKVTATGGNGMICRIRDALYTGERGVTIPVGASVMAPARIRIEKGVATPDRRFETFNLRHRNWSEPETLLDPVQPDGSLALHWKERTEKAWHSATMRIKALPVEIESLHALPDGRVLGTTRRYQESFGFDPKTGAFEIFGKLPMSGTTAETIDGKVWMVAYPGVRIMVYDPARPWTLGMARPGRPVPAEDSPDSNPRQMTHAGVVKERMPAHYPRGLARGADGMLYIGAHCERSAVGGALGWLDPTTGKLDALAREPFLVLDCAGIAAAEGGRTIVYSSHVVSDPSGKTPKAPEAKLFVIDAASKKIVKEFVPFPGAPGTGEVLARGRKVYGFLKEKVYVFDLDVGRVTAEAALAGAPRDPQWGPDGRIYLFAGSDFTRMEPETLEMTSLGSVETTGPFIFAGGDAYIGGRAELRRVKGVASARQ